MPFINIIERYKPRGSYFADESRDKIVTVIQFKVL